MDKKTEAYNYHHIGYNCAQAAIMPFCDELGFDKEQTFKMAEAFGFGMGTAGTCGAVSAIAFAMGMKNSNGNLGEGERSKGETYKLIREAIEKFQVKNGSVTCRELKGMDTGKVLRSCDGCIEDAVEIIEEMLAKL
ncbi:MAG: C-GCAxxG-C-C family protein [Clostridia bacterium]|nr:C-GCAxxG-C-C family protein [Clostridia bacterium]MDO5302277.1 C-GCAxxG-C-C family protein [Clostridia bacterium]